jgi:hypothetical protein
MIEKSGRLFLKPAAFGRHLLQHAEPSAGWAQQAPLFSSFD